MVVFGLALLAVLSQSAGDPEIRGLWEEAIERQKDRQWDRAAERYRRILEAREDLAGARVYLGETLWFSGDEEGARAELTAARRASPELLLPLLLLARLEGGDSPELAERVPHPAARANLLRNVLLDGESFVPLERPGLVLAAMGDLDRAFADYEAARMADPFSIDMHRHMGNAFFKASRSLEAAEAFRGVVDRRPDDAGAWGQLGSSYLRLLWWEPAIEALERANSLAGERPSGLLALGYAYERKPDFEKALSVYRRAGELAPRWAQPPYREGRALLKLVRLDEAERVLRRALELDPEMAEAACFLGAVLLESNDVPAATAALERATALGPRYAKAHFYLGQAYLRAGRTEEARAEIAAYERLTALSAKTGDEERP